MDLQDALNTLSDWRDPDTDFQELEVDGVFEQSTRQRFMEFQRACGMPADGIASPRVWQHIQTLLNRIPGLALSRPLGGVAFMTTDDGGKGSEGGEGGGGAKGGKVSGSQEGQGKAVGKGGADHYGKSGGKAGADHYGKYGGKGKGSTDYGGKSGGKGKGASGYHGKTGGKGGHHGGKAKSKQAQADMSWFSAVWGFQSHGHMRPIGTFGHKNSGGSGKGSGEGNSGSGGKGKTG